MQSLRELYRIGMGPSSSHTMAPRKAAQRFLEDNPDAFSYRVTLYGSLAATGKGHFTDQAILDVLGAERTQIVWQEETVLPYHTNAMKFEALNDKGETFVQWTTYSVGGGALQDEGEKPAEEIYSFKDFSEIVAWAKEQGRPLWAAAVEYEGEEILSYLTTVWNQMQACVRRGLEHEDVLPGGLRLARKAYSFYKKALAQRSDLSRTGLLAAYSLAVSEENAGRGIVVTAPTCGSCGVVAGVLYYLKYHQKVTDREIINALATAGLVGNTVKQNGSISGAEVGCQGEVGVACAMAAAATAQLFGGTIAQIEYAAEIGLEHFLGLTCDPVMGLVQIPCIERNAIAANRSVAAAEYALYTDGQHRVSFDDVVKAMRQTGHDLPPLYKETAQGGLATLYK
ncbi:MAG: L-serine ammonia-lyase [Alphaproteobacteria bacterium]|nr:L-serine ammonia-lyase [Alphaproteobacteria bacterium]